MSKAKDLLSFVNSNLVEATDPHADKLKAKGFKLQPDIGIGAKLWTKKADANFEFYVQYDDENFKSIDSGVSDKDDEPVVHGSAANLDKALANLADYLKQAKED